MERLQALILMFGCSIKDKIYENSFSDLRRSDRRFYNSRFFVYPLGEQSRTGRGIQKNERSRSREKG
jgi:hypothetical protein